MAQRLHDDDVALETGSVQEEHGLLHAREAILNKSRGLWSEFKAFCFKGNVIDLAVAVIVGAAFQAVVTSFSADILMPPIGIAVGSNLDEWFYVIKDPPASSNSTGPFNTRAEAAAAGAVTLNIGHFFQTVINLFVICLCLFVFLKIFLMARQTVARKKAQAAIDAPPDRLCNLCYEVVKPKATKCPHCTGDLQTDDDKKST